MFVFSLVFIQSASAASLSLAPASSTLTVGNITTIKIYVNTENQAINNGEATIQFPTDMLEVISVTKSSSIFSLWVEEPSFSNFTGKIVFNGGVPNPGYTGGSGYIASVTFKAKKQGQASIIFTDGAVRANDGLGTDVLTSKNGSVIQINAPKIIEVPVVAPVKTPVKDNDKNSIISEPFIPTIRFEGNHGIVKLTDEKYINNADYYSLQIDNEPSFKVIKDQLVNYEYTLPIQNEGAHTLIVVSFDKNGKYNQSILDYVSPAISIPILSLSSFEITKGQSVNIIGKTDYPNEQVEVTLENEGKEIGKYTQKISEDGTFLITTDEIKTVGSISIWGKTIINKNIQSGQSEKIYLKVSETAVVKVTLAIFFPLLWLIIIIALLLLLLILLYLGWHKFFGLKKKIDKELENTEKEVHKAMVLLKEELNDQLSSLEKIKVERNLNEKEEKIFDEIKANIDGIEDFIEKKLKKII